MNTKELPAQPIKGLIDGMTVLQQLAVARESLSSLELANELGIEKTRVNRILKTLTYSGMVHRTSNRRYLPGPGMHIFAAQSLSSSGLFHNSVLHLKDLIQFGHIIALGVLWRDKLSYLFHHFPDTPFLDGVGKNLLFPATQSSLGMILLSQKNTQEIKSLYAEKETIPGYESMDSLLDHICEIRKCGYAVLKNKDSTTIAVKIGKPAYAAIGISGIIDANDTEKYVNILFENGRLIENEMFS